MRRLVSINFSLFIALIVMISVPAVMAQQQVSEFGHNPQGELVIEGVGLPVNNDDELCDDECSTTLAREIACRTPDFTWADHWAGRRID